MLKAMCPVTPQSSDGSSLDPFARYSHRRGLPRRGARSYMQYNPRGPKVNDWRQARSQSAAANKRSRSRPKSSSPESSVSPAKKLRKLAPSVIERIDSTVSRLLIDDYFNKHHVDVKLSNKINDVINEFETFILSQTTPVGMHAKVVPYGSFASGLASREDSSIDLLLVMYGEINSDEASLAEAFAGGLYEFPLFNTITLQNDGRILCGFKNATGGGDLPDLLIRVVKGEQPSAFYHYILHAKLMRSYSNCSPLVAPLICIVRRWAKDNLPNNNNNLSGFQWSLLCIAFLQKQQLLPNLHTARRQGLRQLKYGYLPRQTFPLISTTSEAEHFGLRFWPMHDSDIGNVFLAFLRWLHVITSTTTTTTTGNIVSISEESVSPTKEDSSIGSLILVDPLSAKPNELESGTIIIAATILPYLSSAAENGWVRLVDESL